MLKAEVEPREMHCENKTLVLVARVIRRPWLPESIPQDLYPQF
jgi:hypothetical protein